MKKALTAKSDSIPKLIQKITRLENTILKLENKVLKYEQKTLKLQAENQKLKSMSYEERLQMLEKYSKEEPHETPPG
jgi:exonuclease VII small subunit